MTWTVTALSSRSDVDAGRVDRGLGAATATNRIPHPASRIPHACVASSLERWIMVSKKVFGICAQRAARREREPAHTGPHGEIDDNTSHLRHNRSDRSTPSTMPSTLPTWSWRWSGIGHRILRTFSMLSPRPCSTACCDLCSVDPSIFIALHCIEHRPWSPQTTRPRLDRSMPRQEPDACAILLSHPHHLARRDQSTALYFATPLCCPLPMVVGSSNHIPTTPSSLRTVRAWRAAQSHQSERLRLYTSIGPPTLGFALSPLRDLPP